MKDKQKPYENVVKAVIKPNGQEPLMEKLAKETLRAIDTNLRKGNEGIPIVKIDYRTQRFIINNGNKYGGQHASKEGIATLKGQSNKDCLFIKPQKSEPKMAKSIANDFAMAKSLESLSTHVWTSIVMLERKDGTRQPAYVQTAPGDIERINKRKGTLKTNELAVSKPFVNKTKPSQKTVDLLFATTMMGVGDQKIQNSYVSNMKKYSLRNNTSTSYARTAKIFDTFPNLEPEDTSVRSPENAKRIANEICNILQVPRDNKLLEKMLIQRSPRHSPMSIGATFKNIDNLTYLNAKQKENLKQLAQKEFCVSWKEKGESARYIELFCPTHLCVAALAQPEQVQSAAQRLQKKMTASISKKRMIAICDDKREIMENIAFNKKSGFSSYDSFFSKMKENALKTHESILISMKVDPDTREKMLKKHASELDISINQKKDFAIKMLSEHAKKEPSQRNIIVNANQNIAEQRRALKRSGHDSDVAETHPPVKKLRNIVTKPPKYIVNNIQIVKPTKDISRHNNIAKK